jgi:hypothetical protein
MTKKKWGMKLPLKKFKSKYIKSRNPKYGFRHIEIWALNGGLYKKGWHIHHINHKPKDNRLANLIAIPKTLHEWIHYTNYLNNKRLNKTTIKKHLKLFIKLIKKRPLKSTDKYWVPFKFRFKARYNSI